MLYLAACGTDILPMSAQINLPNQPDRMSLPMLTAGGRWKPANLCGKAGGRAMDEDPEIPVLVIRFK